MSKVLIEELKNAADESVSNISEKSVRAAMQNVWNAMEFRIMLNRMPNFPLIDSPLKSLGAIYP